MPLSWTVAAFIARIIAVGGRRNNLVNARDKMHDPLAAGGDCGSRLNSSLGRTSRYSPCSVLILVAKKLKITVCRSADEMLRIRPLWDGFFASGKYTVFQNSDLNLLAADRFANREEPYVIC